MRRASLAGLVVPRPLLNFIKEPLEEAGDQVSGIDLSVCLYQTAQIPPELITAPIPQSCTSLGGHINRIGLRIKECRGSRTPGSPRMCEMDQRWSTQSAHPLLMLTGLHALDVMSPLRRSCRPKSGSTRKRPCFHNWSASRLRQRNRALHRAERSRSAGNAPSLLPVVLGLALRNSASRARNDNHGQSIILVGRSACSAIPFGGGVLAAPSSQYRGIPIPSSQGRLT